MKLRFTLAIVLYFGCFSTAVNAHSFNLVYIADMSAPSGLNGLDGLLFATKERDAHEFEESDGHLGGLDSYLIKIDRKINSPLSTKQKNRIQISTPTFAIGFNLDTVSNRFLRDNGISVVDPVNTDLSTLADAEIASIIRLNGGSFEAEFRQEFGYPPTREAVYGYLSARIIAAVVLRSSAEDRSSPNRLNQILRLELENFTFTHKNN